MNKSILMGRLTADTEFRQIMAFHYVDLLSLFRMTTRIKTVQGTLTLSPAKHGVLLRII